MRGSFTFVLMLTFIATSIARAATTRPANEIDVDNPTLVTLRLKDTPFKDACAALARQSPVPTHIRPIQSAKPQGFEPVTLDLENQPYLVALAKLCIAAKAAPNQFCRADGIDLAPLQFFQARRKDVDPIDLESSWLASPTVTHGPAMVLARSITATHFQDVTDATRKPTPSMILSLVLFTEPQIRVTAISPFAELTEAIDENGQSLLPDYAWKAQWINNPSASSYREFPGVLRPKPPVGRKLVRVKGAVHVRVVKQIEPMKTVDLAIPLEFADLPLP